MSSYGLSLLELSEREAFGTKISEQGIGTRAWRVYVGVDNPSGTKNEISRFRFSEVGFGTADMNSVAVYTSPPYGSSLQFSKFSDEISWSSQIPPGTTVYTLWFDDDSNFSDRSQAISGSDNLTQTVWPPEPVWLIQHNALQALSVEAYASAKETYNFRIRLLDGNATAFSYGLTPPVKQSVAVASKPVLYQKPNADIGLARMIVEVWR
jgi:hypothetical protein